MRKAYTRPVVRPTPIGCPTRFKETVGKTPMEYLTRWRMMLTGDKLTGSPDSISEIALALGYESESPSARLSNDPWAAPQGNTARRHSSAAPHTESTYSNHMELANAG